MKKDKHGDSHTRLYTTWEALKFRVKRREDCFIYPCWNRYIFFKEWALSSGYKDNLCICRFRDIGNYEPNNVRWDTHGNNMKESHSRFWEITDPEGVSFCIINMKDFCKGNGLSSKRMSDVNYGLLSNHQGYTCKRIKQPYRLEDEYVYNTSLDKDHIVPKKSNINREKFRFKLVHEDGREVEVTNLGDFCRKNKLERRNLSGVCNGRRKSCGGWRCLSKEPI